MYLGENECKRVREIGEINTFSLDEKGLLKIKVESEYIRIVLGVP